MKVSTVNHMNESVSESFERRKNESELQEKKRMRNRKRGFVGTCICVIVVG